MKTKTTCSLKKSSMLGWTYSTASTFASVASAAIICFPMSAHAFDIDAGDFVAPPPGTNLALLYFQHSTRDSLYANGNKLPGNNKLDADIAILRGVHWFKLGDYTALNQVILPFGTLEGKGSASGLGKSDGAADLILSQGIWLKSADRKGTNWGVAHFLFVPTGSYDKNSALNLGENRWKWTLQTGLAQGLTENLSLDLTADVTFFGNNNQANATNGTLSQDRYYQTQAHLRYNITDGFHLLGSLSYEWGGEREINGVSQNDEQKKSKFSVGAGYWVTPSIQLLAVYGQDIHVENGFKEDSRVNLRMVKAF